MKIQVSITKNGDFLDVYYDNGVKFANFAISVKDGVMSVDSNGYVKPPWLAAPTFLAVIKEAYENHLARGIVDDYSEQRFEYDTDRADKTMRNHMMMSHAVTVTKKPIRKKV